MNDKEKEQITELWIDKINEFISKLDINDYLKKQLYNALMSQKELIKSGVITDEIFGTTSFGTKSSEKFYNECFSFINYLYKIMETKGLEYFEFGIEYALNNDSNQSFIDNFLRFIVITNYDDIEVIEDINVDSILNQINDYNAAQGSVRAYLGGFLLCDLSQFSAHKDENGNLYLDFYNFHSRKNMTRTKIGTLLIRKILHRLIYDNKLCDFSLGSVWVMKNNSLGKKFYEKLGFRFLGPSGEFVDYDYYDDCIKVKREDYPNLTEIEFDKLRKKMGGNFCVIIPSQEKQTILDRDFEFPYIEYNGKKIDCTTEFIVSKKTL